MKSWKETIIDQLHSKSEGINEKDFRFFRIAEFERMINRTDELSVDCDVCKAFKNEIEIVVATIDEAVHTPGKLRRKYDHLIDRIAKHQRKNHGYYPPYYFTYNYSFLGMLAGSATGLLVGYLVLPHDVWYFILSGFVIGLLAARILGARKDKAVRANDKLL